MYAPAWLHRRVALHRFFDAKNLFVKCPRVGGIEQKVYAWDVQHSVAHILLYQGDKPLKVLDPGLFRGLEVARIRIGDHAVTA